MFQIVRPTKKPYINQGMEKSGNSSSVYNVWTTITGWVIRSGYPGTVITSNGLFVPAGTKVNLYAQTYRGNAHSGSQTRILANGSVIATGTDPSIACIVSLSNYIPVTDEILTIQATATSTLSNRDIVISGPNSYFTVERA